MRHLPAAGPASDQRLDSASRPGSCHRRDDARRGGAQARSRRYCRGAGARLFRRQYALAGALSRRRTAHPDARARAVLPGSPAANAGQGAHFPGAVMTGDTRLFTFLQHGDSFFPGGLTSFSWGLEQLFEEKRVTDAAGLIRCIEAELRFRWASFDRAFLSASHRAAADLDGLAKIDRLCHVSIAARELREGSLRAGQALLAVHAKLGTQGAQA